MGKLILLIIIIFAAYWAWKYYTSTKEPPTKKLPDKINELFGNSEDEIESLIIYFDKKISDIESKSIEEIQKAEDKLKFYKSQLEKLTQIKNQQK